MRRWSSRQLDQLHCPASQPCRAGTVGPACAARLRHEGHAFQQRLVLKRPQQLEEAVQTRKHQSLPPEMHSSFVLMRQAGM
jgi:hypothetical protein